MKDRDKRVAKAIQHCIQKTIRFGEHSAKIDINTEVTRVEMTSDLSLARIYIAPPSENDAHAEKVLRAFEKAVPYFRKMVAEEINIRYAPDIKFYLDIAFRKGENVLELLKKIEREGNE